MSYFTLTLPKGLPEAKYEHCGAVLTALKDGAPVPAAAPLAEAGAPAAAASASAPAPAAAEAGGAAPAGGNPMDMLKAIAAKAAHDINVVGEAIKNKAAHDINAMQNPPKPAASSARADPRRRRQQQRRRGGMALLSSASAQGARQAPCGVSAVPAARALLARRRAGPLARAKPLNNNSFDAEDDLDSELAEELSRFRGREAWSQVAQHLDLVWKVGRSRGSRATCTCCQGSGEEECAWCHGTGALMVGDTLFRSAAGGSNCPVCKGKGHVACENCRGTGYRAAWLQGPDHCRNPV
ncbi:hypothetical protein HT031_002984 [Scenedesmus sp. PABB004]|nr:hypothetical protein HT031_002984 [Scenedesmus sp. PABB004]